MSRGLSGNRWMRWEGMALLCFCVEVGDVVVGDGFEDRGKGF